MTTPICPLPLAVVIETVHAVMGVTPVEMARPCRRRHWQVSAARAIIVYAARRYTIAGYVEIARGLGMYSHASAFGANERMERWLRGGTSQAFPEDRRKWVVERLAEAQERLDRLMRDRERVVRDEVAYQAELVKVGMA